MYPYTVLFGLRIAPLVAVACKTKSVVAVTRCHSGTGGISYFATLVAGRRFLQVTSSFLVASVGAKSTYEVGLFPLEDLVALVVVGIELVKGEFP